MRALILPTGVTVETVTGLFKYTEPDVVIAMYIDDGLYLDKKKMVLDTLKTTAKMLGTKFIIIPVDPSTPSVSKLYKVLLEIKPDEIYLSAMTGSRFLLVSSIMPLRTYSRSYRVPTYIITGVEGGEWRVDPLEGFLIELNKLTGSEKQLLVEIYKRLTHEESISINTLMEELGYSRAIYKTLKRLEEKGLIRRKRGAVMATYPGSIAYEVIRYEYGTR